MIETPVLIVGGGPVGMALGVALERFGVDHMIVERNEATTTHPKSRGCTARTMETFRVWGIEDRVRARGLAPEADITWWCESGTGRVLGRTQPEPVNLNAPAQKCMVAQDVVEEELDGLLKGSKHTDLRRGHEMLEFAADEDGVTARIRNLASGEESEVRASYLIGCDGAGSRVRKTVGIEMAGPDTLLLMANYYYRADLSHLPHSRQAVGFAIVPTDPDVPQGAILATGSDATRWLFLAPVADEDAPLFSEDQLAGIVRAHWGIPDLKVELINVMTWRVSAQIPESFGRGRVLLAGDAAHRFPPAGGMGLNSGIQDAQNLGWKLGLVLQGLAPERLLDTYSDERRPVALSNSEWSIGNSQRLMSMGEAFAKRLEDPDGWNETILDFHNHLHSSGQAMGYVYQSGAVIDDGSRLPTPSSRYYWPTDRPGARFPHMWLDAGWTESTIDWFDDAFVLVCAPNAAEWRAAGEAVAADSTAPLRVKVLPMMAAPFTFDYDEAVLVRPDGHVAWRPGSLPGDKATALRDALDTVIAARAGA